MADVTKSVAIIFEGEDKTASAAKSVSDGFAGIERATKAATSAGNLWQDASGRWRNELGQFATSSELAAAGIAKTGIASEKAAVSAREMADALRLVLGSLAFKEFIDANTSVETFTKSMTLITGSSESAAESLEFVRRTADTLGLDITGAAENFVSLSAAAKGTALEGDGARAIFEAVSKAMSLLGKSSSDTNGALLAIQQIISKGTVSAEELRGQLGERLPGAFQIAARAMGVTTAELGKFLESGKLTAEDFLPKFTDELNKTFGDTSYVVTFTAELNRLINALKEVATSGPGGGIFAELTRTLSELTDTTKATSVEIETIGAAIAATQKLIGTGDFSAFAKELNLILINGKAANASIVDFNESNAETARLFHQSAEAAASYSASIQFGAETERLQRYEQAATSSLTAVSDAYKLLGVNASKSNADYIGALETLVASTESTAADVGAAFKSMIPKIDNVDELERFSAAAARAAADGKISWEQWAVSVTDASQAFLKNTGYVKENTDEVKKQADETKRAQEAAEKMRLELEKLASDERIKLIEARVELNVAELEAQTARVQAAFESINNTINSTGDVIISALGLLKDFDSLDWGAIRIIEAQLEKENQLRRDAFELQKRLTEVQIEQLRAQTQALQGGDAFIKVDGAGLQPHLEAFMWEILRTIQTRVNRDGLPLLLGVL